MTPTPHTKTHHTPHEAVEMSGGFLNHVDVVSGRLDFVDGPEIPEDGLLRPRSGEVRQ